MEKNSAYFWTIEDASSCHISVQLARRFTSEEKATYAEDYRELGMVCMGDSTELPYITWDDTPHRKSDGSFLGCSNRAWIISEEEKNQYLTLNEKRQQAKQEQARIEGIKYLRSQIACMEAQGTLPTRLEAAHKAKLYNDLYNEGGEGFVPHFYCQEELDTAKKELDALLALEAL